MVLVVVGTVAVLWSYGVSVSDLVLFGVYLALGLALPGVLLIRVLYPGIRTVAEEIALGLALGYAVEVLVYIAVRAAGAPLLVAVWPIAVYLVFLVVPRLRRHWRSPVRARTPIWWSWCLALLFALLVVWSAVVFFRANSLTWPDLVMPIYDMPFHLALIGELKHHVPPTVPWIAGDPLYYHWFVYAHQAASSWITGIEPVVLLCRLSMLPMLAAFLIVIAMTGHRVTGSRPAALVIAAGAIFVGAPSLFLGQSPYPFAWGGLLDNSWNSPSQTFGGLLFALVVVLLLDVFRRRRGAGLWVLLGIFLVVVMGAKAVYLPMLGVGLAAVAVVEVVRRRPPWSILIALAMTAACLVFAQLVLFGGVRNGMTFYPLWAMRRSWADMTGRVYTASPPLDSLLGVTLLYTLCWAIALCGIVGLLSRPRSLTRSDTVLMLGIGAAGFIPVFLLGHAGHSHFFFLWSAFPSLVTVAVQGILILLRRARVSPTATVVAVGAGMLAACLIPVVCRVRVPLPAGAPEALVYLPYVTLLVIGVLTAVALTTTMGTLRTWALMTVALSAIGLPACWYAIVGKFAQKGIDKVSIHGRGIVPEIPQGTLTAARWLRAHADPDDVVATNTHCRWGRENPCDTVLFWLSALSERHVLVEGWGYAPTRRPIPQHPDQIIEDIPFWDKERLRANDAVFNAPSAAAVQRLRDRYGVRWLVADQRLSPHPMIGQFADLTFRSGAYSIYRLRDNSRP
ncbi:hypothetical protein EDD27_7303 [Nonomuraea polychroma]|uniref:4-amino-4-deoxy-L-arabinose transferase-like glycosyltransferase n=1 Tax=Nonomuraea polychroma TaxID=46176 RepID=A0A438MGI7_9ACTN|nr:hypothetical protein EDD27_7303 [Nonomuraea polychroma]